MTVEKLIEKLKTLPQDAVIVCQDDSGGWDNIIDVVGSCCPKIIFGGGNPFSD